MIENLLEALHHHQNLPTYDFILVVRDFSLYTGLLSNPLLLLLLNLCQISLYFSSNSWSFIKKTYILFQWNCLYIHSFLEEEVTTNMTWHPQNIWMICITVEHKSSCDTFFLIYCKNITNFLFWELCACLATSIKNDNANF